MATYGAKSSAILNTAVFDLQVLFKEVVKEFDNAIIYSYRTPVEQFELYKQGRELVNGVWQIVDQKRVVTYKDGYIKLSKHNYSPSQAVDAIAYPVNWKDRERMYYFAGYVLGVASRLKLEGKISCNIRWGGDWDRDTLVMDETFMDLVHFETVYD